MSRLHITGGKRLSGTIPVYGSKNAALPLIAASLLTTKPIELANIPPILDVDNMLRILKAIGVAVTRQGTNLGLTASTLQPKGLPVDVVGQLRGSILLLGPLLGRCKKISLPQPGGDVIGARPIGVHLDALEQLGAVVTGDKGSVMIDGTTLKAGPVTLREASVTATENIMMVAATLPGTTTIHIAAQEPHVAALGDLLSRMGARVTGEGSHTITIMGSGQLQGVQFNNIPDMLEAGLFILLAAATQSELTVENVPTDYLKLFFKKLEDIRVALKEDGTRVHVTPAQLSSFKVQTLPYPGIATDLQAPFSVVATQAAGTSLIHDPMYESRFRHCDELIKMGASITVCDPHRVVIEGPTPLYGRHIKSPDIRSGATLIMAGLVAEGETIIDDTEIIDRGYAELVERLQNIGADIQRCE